VISQYLLGGFKEGGASMELSSHSKKKKLRTIKFILGDEELSDLFDILHLPWTSLLSF
jgi:hypothetical protein